MHPLAKRVLTEPLLHFLLLGAGLFALDAMQNSAGHREPGLILVTRGDVRHLAAGFEKTRQRGPSAEELAGLVRERVRDEVYAREARALGLDRDDYVVRQRLRQKLEFIFEDVAAFSDPSDADLEAYLEAHPGTYQVEATVTFLQVYLNPARHGADLARDADALLVKLRAPGDGVDPAQLGDATLLEHRFEALPAGTVVGRFGPEFAASLAAAPQDDWRGPIPSGYGVHLVRVVSREPGRVPPLAQVRDAVRRDWQNARRLEVNERFYQELLGRYTVTIEGLDQEAPTGTPGDAGSR